MYNSEEDRLDQLQRRIDRQEEEQSNDSSDDSTVHKTTAGHRSFSEQNSVMFEQTYACSAKLTAHSKRAHARNKNTVILKVSIVCWSVWPDL